MSLEQYQYNTGLRFVDTSTQQHRMRKDSQREAPLSLNLPWKIIKPTFALL